jgi:class 3 adenylate cyclase
MALDRQFRSLEDFLTSTMGHVDGLLDDGAGASFPVKGREVEATVLFADITAFSTRTLGLNPAATLVYVQNFFAWITAEALSGRPGIVDKYIGDEVMVVFSEEFGSEDPFADAVQAAAAMSRHDVHAYQPLVGIASGLVIVGYAGTAFRYNVSVFGAPVALAARCAAVKPSDRATFTSPRRSSCPRKPGVLVTSMM